MSTPPRPIRRDTRVFISAVTRELGSIRQLVKKALEDNDLHAIEQDNFPPDYRDLVDKLRERINSCDAVVHIAGHCHGAEPPERPADAPRRSYTQLEYDIAVELGKPVYVFLTGDHFPTDPHQPEPPELRALQAAHRQRLASTGKDYNPTDSTAQLDQKIRSLQIKVERLQEELEGVDDQVARLNHRSRKRFVLASIALASLVAIVALVLSRVGKDVDTNLTGVNTKLEELRKQFADPDVLTGKIKSHIRKRAEEEVAAARAHDPGDWRKRDEIEKRRDQALARVEELVDSIRTGLAGQPDPIFIEAATILDKQGVEEAIRYLEQKQPAIDKQIEAAKSLRDQADLRLREAYRPRLLQAKLYEASLKWDAALKIREEVARDNPRWFEARNGLGGLLLELARFGDAEPHLRAAVELAANPPEEATGFNNLAGLLKATNRLAEAEPLFRRALAINERSYGPDHPNVARDLSNLAELLRATNRLAAAEPLDRRALAINERSYGPDHPNVARDFNNLALLLKATNRLAEAEPLYRRALAIDERSYGPDHTDVAIRLNNLAGLLDATNRRAAAEPLLRRALAITERSFGPDHPKVALNLSNLAFLLGATNRRAEAEPLMRQALEINEWSYGPDHPDVAIDLNNLAELLGATNRLAEAEPLYRRALAIAERSYGPDHPDVATNLNNLAALLDTTNRRAAAEPLYSRGIRILVQFQRSTGHEHPNLRLFLTNYRQLLTFQKHPEPEIVARIKAATEGTDKLVPIAPEVERILGPARPVADVLAALDRQYKEQGKPAVYFLGLKEAIAPHLDQLLRPNGEGLNAPGVAAFRGGAYGDAIVHFEAVLEFMADRPVQGPAKLITRMNRAAAMFMLGLVEPARDELSRLLPELEKPPATDPAMNGQARYHLSLCQWRLGEPAAALSSAEQSLAAYDRAPKDEPVDPALRQKTEKLLADLKGGKAPPPRPAIDGNAAIAAARARYRAREALTKLGIDQPCAPLLDPVLGPARPTQEVLDALDRQYRAAGKPAVWTLPLSEPIAPHLDELLGKPSR